MKLAPSLGVVTGPCATLRLRYHSRVRRRSLVIATAAERAERHVWCRGEICTQFSSAAVGARRRAIEAIVQIDPLISPSIGPLNSDIVSVAKRTIPFYNASF